MERLSAILFLLGVAAAGQASAMEPPPGSASGTRLQLGVGLNYGGDKLVSFEYSDGSTQDLRAGNGFGFDAGIWHQLEDSDWALQGTLGYYADSSYASNSDAAWRRFVLDGIAFRRHGRHRLGGGLTYHINPTLDLDNLGPRFEADNAFGAVIEYGWMNFSIRYTRIEYRMGGQDLDGSSIGLRMVMTW